MEAKKTNIDIQSVLQIVTSALVFFNFFASLKLSLLLAMLQHLGLLSPGRCRLSVFSLLAVSLSHPYSLDWFFLDFHQISGQMLSRQKVCKGPCLIPLPLPCLIFFLALIVFSLLIYAITTVYVS